MGMTTEQLIAEYNERMATRFVRCDLGSTRLAARQRKIDAIVNELSARADNGDADALAWYEAT